MNKFEQVSSDGHQMSLAGVEPGSRQGGPHCPVSRGGTQARVDGRGPEVPCSLSSRNFVGGR